MVEEIDPHITFMEILTPLFYEDSSKVSWHVMHRVMPNALILEFPSVFTNTVFTAIFIKFTFADLGWSWPAALTLGSILAATDPVAVVAALKELHVSEKLSLLIGGESVFNDGSAVLLFNLSLDLCISGNKYDWGTSYSIGYFFKMALGGSLLGLAFTVQVYLLLKHDTQDPKVEVMVVLWAVWGSIFTGEHSEIQVSDVLAVIALRLFMPCSGQFRLAKSTVFEHHAIVEYIGILVTESLFFIAWLVAYRCTAHEHILWEDSLKLAWLYVIIHITRFVAIALAIPG